MISYFERVLSVIDDSIHSLDVEAYERLVDDCAQHIKGGGKVIASGLGKNVPVCEKFAGTMMSLGLQASFLHSNTAMHGDLGMVGPKDVVLLLSKSGNTAESILLGQQLINRSTDVWAMTFSSSSALSDMFEKSIVLDLKEEGDPWNIVPNNSTTVYLIILQGLAMSIANKLGVTLEDFKRNHPGGAIGKNLAGEIK